MSIARLAQWIAPREPVAYAAQQHVEPRPVIAQPVARLVLWLWNEQAARWEERPVPRPADLVTLKRAGMGSGRRWAVVDEIKTVISDERQWVEVVEQGEGERVCETRRR